MTDLPSIKYACSHCGATATFQLVPGAAHEPGPTAAPSEVPSIDFRCLRCGTVQTYRLVPEDVQTPAM
jgi:DNA-directed RNA polymerase subunit RPC12/RpoP